MIKEQIKYFFSKYKRIILTVSACVLAFVLVTTIAVSNSSGGMKLDEESVQTSNPTKITFIMPIENGKIIKDYSNTALKYNSTLKQWEAHKAVDIKGGEDANVMAVYDGEIISVETNYLMGTTIKIKHNNKLETIYSSLASDVKVKVGDKVKTGDVLGKVSNTAKSESNDGAHLHFEVLLDGSKVDPNLYLEGVNK